MTEQETVYQDRGCQESPSCLKCHLPRCVFDEPWDELKKAWSAKDAERANAVLLAEQTMTRVDAIRKVAEKYGVTVRTIWRILARVGG